MLYACNPASMRFFNALPDRIRCAMIEQMEEIHSFVLSVCPGAVITSAFRTPTYSRSLNGNANSLHGYGLCLDYVSESVDVPALQKSGLFRFVLEESDHVHITGK